MPLPASGLACVSARMSASRRRSMEPSSCTGFLQGQRTSAAFVEVHRSTTSSHGVPWRLRPIRAGRGTALSSRCVNFTAPQAYAARFAVRALVFWPFGGFRTVALKSLRATHY